jgi:hypothetical protein
MRYSDRKPDPFRERRDRFRRMATDRIYRLTRIWPNNDLIDSLEDAFIRTSFIEIPDSLVEDLEKVHYAGGFYSRKAIIEQALTALGFEVRK